VNQYERVDEGASAHGGQILKHVQDPKRWLVKVFIGRDAKDRKKYASKVVHGTNREARAVLIELQQQKQHGRLAPRGATRLADLVEEWEQHKARDVSPRTLKAYVDALHWYVLPTLGRRRLHDISLREIDALYGDMAAGTLPAPEANEEGRIEGWQGGALSARTIRLTHVALSRALKQAVKWGLISFNPAAEATLPTDKPKERRPLTLTEREAFIAASQGSFHHLLFLTLLGTGLRPGEACGLMWSDLDFANERIHVQRAVTPGADGQRMTAHPKTSKSRRALPMFDLRDPLLAHRAWQAERGLDAGGYVFTNQDGGMLAPWAFNKRELLRIGTAASIGFPVTLYTFRHTFATVHLQLGTPLKVVSDWLGHSTILQTANTYQHVSDEIATDYAERYLQRLAQATQADGKTAPN